MLFQAYTGGRPAEFVHASKGKASQDPLGKAEHANNRRRPREAQNEDYDDESNVSDSSEFVDEDLFDDDKENDDDGDDDGYNSDGTDASMTEDTDNRDTAMVDESGEAVRKYKALCYEDICLWVVQNPKRGGGETFLRWRSTYGITKE